MDHPPVTVASLTRSVTFRASHRYYRPDWSAERNAAVFGDCAVAPGHEHLYECRVTVCGPLAQDTGMILDLRDLDRLIAEEVLGRFADRHINHDVPEFAFGRAVPTGETLAAFIWDRIRPRLPSGVRMECVRVQEAPSLYAEYRGEGD